MREGITVTPFEGKECIDCPAFPFLISEEKSDRGNSFNSCLVQTAFAIWEMLNLQKGLETAAEMNLEEQGGPVVWFFADRRAEWRLYGCYTTRDAMTSKTTHTSKRKHSAVSW
jgi:hypothetical protein